MHARVVEFKEGLADSKGIWIQARAREVVEEATRRANQSHDVSDSLVKNLEIHVVLVFTKRGLLIRFTNSYINVKNDFDLFYKKLYKRDLGVYPLFFA